MRTVKIALFLLVPAILELAATKYWKKIPNPLSYRPTSIRLPAYWGGIAGVYNDIRSQWGTEGFTNEMQAGTDEFIRGASSGGATVHDYNGLNGSNFGSAWGVAFQDINTINGVLKYVQTVDVPDQTRKVYIAQAKFLRAFWYFYLVQTFGEVPLHKEFITVPRRQPPANRLHRSMNSLSRTYGGSSRFA